MFNIPKGIYEVARNRKEPLDLQRERKEHEETGRATVDHKSSAIAFDKLLQNDEPLKNVMD